MPKPSFGCMACRRRRVKCDERTGGCRRCERYGIRCPGYQDPFDVLLRPQDSGRLVTDDRIPVGGFGRERGQDSALLSSHAAEISPRRQTYLTRQPTADIDQLALGAYYIAYCVSSSTIVGLDYLREQGNGCLWAAIKMLGMMQLYQNYQWSHRGDPLLKQYSEATALLNAALSDPSESREDRTLLATLTMSIAETKRSSDFNLHYWSIHTSGAAALMNLRGADQIFSKMGAALYLQMSAQLVIYSILGQRHIPKALQNLRAKIQPYVMVYGHPLWDWHGLMYRFADFWAVAASAFASEGLEDKDVELVVLEALNMHNEVELIFQSAGTYWQYSTQKSEELLPLIDYEHIYHSLLTARIWNDRRIATILLFSTVAKIANSTDLEVSLSPEIKYNSSQLKTYADKMIQKAAKETLAAVPQTVAGLKGVSLKAREPSAQFLNSLDALGISLCNSASEYDEVVFSDQQAGRIPRSAGKLPYMDTCRVQWALYFAVQCEFVEPRLRARLLQLLEDSGKILQIQQWQVLADKVKETLADEQHISGFGRGSDSPQP